MSLKYILTSNYHKVKANTVLMKNQLKYLLLNRMHL